MFLSFEPETKQADDEGVKRKSGSAVKKLMSWRNERSKEGCSRWKQLEGWSFTWV